MISMFLGRSSATRTPAVAAGEIYRAVDVEEMKARLEAAAKISQYCQKQYGEMHALFQQLNGHLEGMHILSTQSVAPTQHIHEVLQSRDIELAALRQELEESKRERVKLATELAERDRTLRHVLQERDGLSKLLVNRTAELDAAQAFLPAADSITDTHAIGLVEALNYEISQASTALVESFEDEPRQLPISKTLSTALAPTVRRIGKPIANALSTPGEDPVLSLQIGLQAFLVRISKVEISRLSFSARASVASKLASIKDCVKRGEPENVAVRWSALCHKYAKAVIDEDLEVEHIAEHLAQQWADAVTLAGYCAELDAADTTTLVLSRVRPQLIEVSKVILELNAILGQKILRGWMYCIGARSGERYDPVTMEMDFQSDDDGLEDTGYRVIGTTALGLQRSEGEEDITLLKSKVAVERVKTRPRVRM